jgi:predicted dehydrogenase
VADRVNLALIGCGRYASGYVQEIVRNPQVRLMVACDNNRAHAEAAASETRAVAVTDWESALDTPGLAGVIIATPNALHARITCAAAARGLHVLCEKPMATSLEDAQAMVHTCAASGVALLIGLSARYDRAFRRAEGLLRAGTLGEPALLVNICHYTLGPAEPGRTWHNDPLQMGGGALIQMGIHGLDRVCWLAAARPVRIYAQIIRAGERWADNVALCQMSFPGELLGQVEVAGLVSASANTLTIHARHGEMVVETGHLRWYDGNWHQESFATDAMALEIQDFLAAIRGEALPSCSGQSALVAHEVCFAAYRSAAEGRVLQYEDDTYC